MLAGLFESMGGKEAAHGHGQHAFLEKGVRHGLETMIGVKLHTEEKQATRKDIGIPRN